MWREPGRLDHAHEDLYFGEGGTYDASELDERASMLSDVREVVGLMNHGLQHLEEQVSRR